MLRYKTETRSGFALYDTKRSGSILTIPEPARGRSSHGSVVTAVEPGPKFEPRREGLPPKLLSCTRKVAFYNQSLRNEGVREVKGLIIGVWYGMVAV